MLILGIDPGSVTTGYGIIDHQGSTATYVASGSIQIGKYELPERLKQIYNDLTQLLLKYRPQQVAVERVFVHKNVSSALKLGQARGVAIAAVACQNLSISEYSAREVKQAIVGYGNADKTQMQMMVKTILKLNGMPAADAADALAIALCHGNSSKFKGQTL